MNAPRSMCSLGRFALATIVFAAGLMLAGWGSAPGVRASTSAHLAASPAPATTGNALPLSPVTWTALGPAPVGGYRAGAPLDAVSGRVDGVAVHPTNPDIIYIAAASGGVWKTVNGGTTWTALTDHIVAGGTPVPLFMGAIALAPSDPRVLYAGTGDPNLGPDKLELNRDNLFYGLGVLTSTDAGAHWTLLGNSPGVFARRSISKIVVDPTDAMTVYVAVGAVATNGLPGNTGIWKSTDGGLHWVDTTLGIAGAGRPAASDAAYSDVVIDPTNPQVLYAAVGDPFGDQANGIYKTTDGGRSWAVAGDLPTGATDPHIGRIALALAPSDHTTLYASLVASGKGAGTVPSGSLYKMMKTTNAGVHWSSLPNTPDYFGAYGLNSPLPPFFGDYDTSLAVDPTNPNIVYAGGSEGNFLETTTGGTNWINLSSFVPQDDQHAIGFDARGRLVVGDDAGIYRQHAPGPTSFVYDDLNGNLNTAQIAGVAIDPTNPAIAYGGIQDNGTLKFTGSLRWSTIDDSDGGVIHVDPFKPTTVYHEIYYDPDPNGPRHSSGELVQDSFFKRSDDNGATWVAKTAGIDLTQPGNFYVPFVTDPAHRGRLLLGTSTVYESTNSGDSWQPLGSRFPDIIDAVAAAPSDLNTIYATARGGHVFVTTDHGTKWVERDPVHLNGRTNATLRFRGLFVDPRNADIAYVVATSFDDATGGGHVWRTTNAGVTWTNISGTLPDLPTWSIVVAVSGPDHAHDVYYVGTDDGVYSSANQGATWAPLGCGLPHAQVQQLDLSPNQSILAAGTYGRGVWELAIPPGGTPSPNQTGAPRRT